MRSGGRYLRIPWLENIFDGFRAVPETPSDPVFRFKDPWPGSAQRGEILVANEADLLASISPQSRDRELTQDDARRIRAHSFVWLRDLRSLGGEAARRTARKLVAAWFDTDLRGDPIAWRPDIVGQRLTAWIGSYDFFASSAGPSIRSDLMEQIASQTFWLKKRIGQVPSGPARFSALAGLAAGAAAVGERESFFSTVDRVFSIAKDNDIGRDGWIRSASPISQLDSLMRLLDLRTAANAVGRVPPEGISEIITLVAGTLATMRAGDGGLSVFNGGEGDSWAIDLALAASGWRRRAALDLPDAGYSRALAGRSLLLIGAQNGAIEFGHGNDRIFVSTGSISDAPAPRFQRDHGSAFCAPMFKGARPLDFNAIERDSEEGATLLTASFQQARPEINWRRRIFLAADGFDLRGEDFMETSSKQAGIIPFHLHPSADAIQVDETSALIRTASGHGWRLRANQAINLSPEPYRGLPGVPSAAVRIELPIYPGRSGRWAIRKESNT
jgi:uncharacterized heparinase superfamily protein